MNKYIDLGLSVKWATCNIGANSPEELGHFFQWGVTIPYRSDRTPVTSGDAISFIWKDYPICNGTSYKMLKYNEIDNKTILDLEDDAAYVNSNGKFRMPTYAEFLELLDACNTEWVENYNGTGINGRLFILKTDSSKTLFFPAAGTLLINEYVNMNEGGYYLSSSRYDTYSFFDWFFDFNDSVCHMNDNYRSFGYSVRGVC